MTLSQLHFSVFACLLAGVVLSGCCDCSAGPDYEEIHFAFSADSLGGTGFRRSELRTAYLITYTQPGFQGLRDTIRQRPANTPPTVTGYFFPVDFQTTTAGETGAFTLYAQVGATRSHRIVVPATSRTFDIDNISQVLADREGDGCNCEEIKERSFTVDGQSKVFDRQGIAREIPTVLQR